MKILTLLLALAFVSLAVPVASAEPAVTLDCYMVYTRYDVGTYTIIRRNSCAVPEFYQCPYEGAPLSECRGLIELGTA